MQVREPGLDEDSPGLFSLLYVSEMCGPDPHELGRICERSRVNNLRDGITGLLVFDGRGFCQFVEGRESGIKALLGRLEQDPRHRRMRVLQLGAVPGPRRFPVWRLGYAYCADPSAIARVVAAQRDADAIEAFTHWVPGLPTRAEGVAP
jgi:hypothetical protein